jgi:hypothetical protein
MMISPREDDFPCLTWDSQGPVVGRSRQSQEGVPGSSLVAWGWPWLNLPGAEKLGLFGNFHYFP